MSLITFKKRLKVGAVFLLLIIYGALFFSVGRISRDKKQETTSKPAQQESYEFEKPLPHLDIQASKVLSSYVKLCSNTVNSFKVSYSRDWFTTYNDKVQECNFFAPYSFIVPQETDENFFPITVKTENPASWESTQKYYENPNDFQNIVAVKNLEINGKSATRVESISTGEGPIDRSFTKMTYLIFDSRAPIVATYQQLSEKDDVASGIKVLEEMVTSLEYF